MNSFISGCLSWLNDWLHRKDRMRMGAVHEAVYHDRAPTVFYGNVALNPGTHTGDVSRPSDK